MNEAPVKQRIKEILLEKKSNPSKLSKEFSMNQKTLNNQINADVQLSASTILLILSAYTDVSAEWLLRGKGEMYLGDEVVSNSKIQSLEAEYNQLLGENRALREMLGMKEKESSSKSA